MLGFGIGEIILIVVVAIIVLGPDKLPNALVEIVKIIRVVKKTINDAKDTLDREVNIAELKKEAIEYKEKLENSLTIDTGHKEIVEDIKKDMNDIEHLFKDYKPKETDITIDNQESSKTHNEEPQVIAGRSSNPTRTRHISDDSLELYNSTNSEDSSQVTQDSYSTNTNNSNETIDRNSMEEYWNKKATKSQEYSKNPTKSIDNNTDSINLDHSIDTTESTNTSFRKSFMSQRENIP